MYAVSRADIFDRPNVVPMYVALCLLQVSVFLHRIKYLSLKIISNERVHLRISIHANSTLLQERQIKLSFL